MSELLNKYHNGIQWIQTIESKYNGPTVTITACTHWWELAWEKSIAHLLDYYQIEQNLTCWKIHLILTNIEWYKKSLTMDRPQDARFIDENLNRCCSLENLAISTAYEVQRALELEPILKQTDVHFDIHSTYTPSQSMLINTPESQWKFDWVFNTDVIYSWITDVQVWKPFIDITIRNWWLWIWIECGDENDSKVYKIGSENSIRLFENLQMLESWLLMPESIDQKENKLLQISSSIIVNDHTFTPAQNFKHNQKVKKWEIIAYSTNKNFVAEENLIILLPNPKLIPLEEYCFLARDKS